MRITSVGPLVVGGLLLTACAGVDAPAEYINTERGCDSDLPSVPITAFERERNTMNTGSVIPLSTVDPVYPKTAEAKKLEGWALIRFDIREDGRVQNPKVALSEPGTLFDSAALNSIRQWTFSPLERDGRAVKQPNQEYVITFCLD